MDTTAHLGDPPSVGRTVKINISMMRLDLIAHSYVLEIACLDRRRLEWRALNNNERHFRLCQSAV